MQFLKRSTPDLVFGISCWKQISGLEHLKSNHLWFELQADKELENRFWIEDIEYPNILLIEVAIDRSIDFTQTYLDYWRSFNCPVIWIINDDISYQSLTHPIYNQLTKNISFAGECILNHSAISDHSITAIARNLLNRSYAKSQQTRVGDMPLDCIMNPEFGHLQSLYDDHDRSAA